MNDPLLATGTVVVAVFAVTNALLAMHRDNWAPVIAAVFCAGVVGHALCLVGT
jgi:uncharacterized membrane protein